ncbi:hypothetical protein BJ741DRAFT_715059 [Chytriomyces cf. hyalinus JEL632]|nr:hypothetical protein BJ741DRAFT_715059 [Chytriomyces cf. hyalinus JEL632]
MHAVLALLALTAAGYAQILTRIPDSLLITDRKCINAVNAGLQSFYDCGFRITATTTTVDNSTTDVAASLCVCKASNLAIINAMKPACSAVANSDQFIGPISEIESSCSVLSGPNSGSAPSSSPAAAASASSPYPTNASSGSSSSNSSSGSSNDGSGSSKKTIIIVVVVVAVILGLAVGIFFFFRSKQQKKKNEGGGSQIDSQLAQPPFLQHPNSTSQHQSAPHSQPTSYATVSAPPIGLNNFAQGGPNYGAVDMPQRSYPPSSAGTTVEIQSSSSTTTNGAPISIASVMPQEKQSQLFPDQLQSYHNVAGNTYTAKKLESFNETSFNVNEAALWTTGQTIAWLKSLQYDPEVLLVFSKNNCDGPLLKAIGKTTETCKEALKTDFGISEVRTRTLLADNICGLFENGATTQAARYGTSGTTRDQLPPGYTEF